MVYRPPFVLMPWALPGVCQVCLLVGDTMLSITNESFLFCSFFAILCLAWRKCAVSLQSNRLRRMFVHVNGSKYYFFVWLLPQLINRLWNDCETQQQLEIDFTLRFKRDRTGSGKWLPSRLQKGGKKVLDSGEACQTLLQPGSQGQHPPWQAVLAVCFLDTMWWEWHFTSVVFCTKAITPV